MLDHKLIEENTALAFCRDCLGWEDAGATFRPPIPGKVINRVGLNPHGTNPRCVFPYTDLSAVMEAVRHWCEQERLQTQLTVDYERPAYEATVFPAGWELPSDRLASVPAMDTACQALLAACVEAKRKLKGNDQKLR